MGMASPQEVPGLGGGGVRPHGQCQELCSLGVRVRGQLTDLGDSVIQPPWRKVKGYVGQGALEYAHKGGSDCCNTLSLEYSGRPHTVFFIPMQYKIGDTSLIRTHSTGPKRVLRGSRV